MAYDELRVVVAQNFLTGTFRGTQSWGSASLGGALSLPGIPGIDIGLWPGTGSQVGLADSVILDSATLTDATPGTTDIRDVDLQTALDTSGAAASMDEVVLLLVLVDSVSDGARLIIDGSVTNGWTAPFRDMTNPATGKLTLNPGFTHPTSTRSVPGVTLLTAGNLASMPVTGSSKVVRIKLVAGSSVAYRLIVVGRTAAS